MRSLKAFSADFAAVLHLVLVVVVVVIVYLLSALVDIFALPPTRTRTQQAGTVISFVALALSKKS